jgi:RimJ/RimL family protein N-acetyltransferase
MSRAQFIKGKNVDLVCLTKADAESLHRWNNDMEIIFNWGGQPFPADLKATEERLESQHKQKNSLMLGIQLSGKGTLIGIGGLSSIEWPWQRAELTMCIGEKDHQGKGYGKEVTMLVLEHAFTKLNLHSIMLRVISYNERGIKCYEACGFKQAGTRRESRIDGDTFYDVLSMDILADEFRSRKVSTE